ncbi:hypothetical protein [Nocardioides sp.]|uniref:hypothetical protein n=1 Tax=Nocardioides sp. TaxID=35761 RepID=UPI003515B207
MRTPRRSPRSAPTPARLLPALIPGLLLPVLLLAGCGGSEDTPAPAPSAPAEGASSADDATTGDATDATELPLLQGEPCRATVVLTGGVKAQWTGEGTVATSSAGPLATYQSAEPADGDPVITLYASGEGFSATAIINSGKAVFSTPTGTGTLDIAPDGSGATVRTTVGNGLAAKVDVEATFTC